MGLFCFAAHSISAERVSPPKLAAAIHPLHPPIECGISGKSKSNISKGIGSSSIGAPVRADYAGRMGCISITLVRPVGLSAAGQSVVC